MKIKQSLVSAMFVMLLLSFSAVLSVKAVPPRIYLEPSNHIYTVDTAYIGMKFNVTVWVENVVADIGGAQINLEFNDDVINVTRWWAPNWDAAFFMPDPYSALPTPPNPGYVHLGAEKGRVQVTVLKGGLPPSAPWGHDGKICILEFNITAAPPEGGELTSTLRIDTTDTYLLDSEAGEVSGVIKENGYYEISKPTGTFALTITSTFGGYTDPSVGTHAYPEGHIVSVLAINSSGYEFGHWELDGAYSGSLNSINVTMDADHALRAVFRAVGNEGDVNGDGNVDLKDAYAIALAFGSRGSDYEYPGSPPSTNWKPECDLNADNRVDLADLFIVFRNYNKVYTP